MHGLQPMSDMRHRLDCSSNPDSVSTVADFSKLGEARFIDKIDNKTIFGRNQQPTRCPDHSHISHHGDVWTVVQIGAMALFRLYTSR